MSSLENHSIKSQTEFLITFCKEFVRFLYNLILVCVGRQEPKVLVEPLRLLYDFIFQAKVTIWLIIANVVIYYLLLLLLYFGKINQDMVLSYIWYPTNIFTGHFIQLITSMFLHANAKHLWLNMLGIFIFGRIVEHKIGPFKTIFIYFFAGVFSAIATSLIYLLISNNNTGSLGASGALMGLVAAAILFAPFYLTYQLLIPLPVMVVGWMAVYADFVGLISPANDNIGHLAHMFGFLSITVGYYLLGEHQQHEMHIGFIVNMISLVLFLGFLFFFWV